MLSRLVAALGRFLHRTLLGMSGRPHPVPAIDRAAQRRRAHGFDR